MRTRCVIPVMSVWSLDSFVLAKLTSDPSLIGKLLTVDLTVSNAARKSGNEQ